MLDFLRQMFKSDFLPHGYCYRWSADVVWLHVVSDLLIALAYYFIPFALIYIVRRRGDLVYPWMFWLFGIFILACGTTHLMSIWVIWQPVYRLDGMVKLLTAAASVPTAILLMRLAPAVIALPSPEQLRQEIAVRKAVEEEVRRLNADLERRVEERTRQLAESEARLQAIVDSAPMLMHQTDLTGKLVFANRGFQKLHGDRQPVIGRSRAEIFPADLAEREEKLDNDVVSQRRVFEFEQQIPVDGETHTWLSVKFPLLDSASQPYGVCAISTDITERKQAEIALRNYGEQMERFAFITSHDMQEPLRTIKTYSQMLVRRCEAKIEACDEDILKYIVEGVDRMVSLVRGLQSYAEMAHKGISPVSVADSAAVLEEVKIDTAALLAETATEIVAGPLPELRVEPVLLRQLFTNLLTNAIKYRGADPPRIEISAERRGQQWEFAFRDNGIGLDMRYADQIFGMFKRLHGSDYPGTGIGLAICKQVVESYGGRIWVASSPGQGATFFFTLPGKGPRLC